MARTKLADGENVLVRTRLHWIGLLNEILFTVAGIAVLVLFFSLRPPGWVWWLLLGAWVVSCFRGVTNWLTSELTVTERRLVAKRGLLSKAGWELPIDRVLDVAFSQTAIQRLVGSGSLLVDSAGSVKTTLSNVPDPEGMKAHITAARDAAESKHRDRAVGGSRGGASRAEQLDLLARLRADGSITDAEFEAEKRRVLDGD